MKSILLLLSLTIASLISHQLLRFWGYNKVYIEKIHPFLEHEKTKTAYSASFTEETYKLDLEKLKVLCETNCILQLPLYWSTDQNFWVLGNSNVEAQHLTGAEKLSDQEIVNRYPNIKRLDAFISFFPKAKFIFNIDINLPLIDKSLIEHIEKSLSPQDFIACSKFGNLSRSLRKQRPHWTRCASTDEITKAHILSSIYLESLAPLPAEFYLIDSKDLNRYSPQLFKELKRRSLFLGVNKVDDSLDSQTSISLLVKHLN